jgi:hypothetical protein
VPVAMLEYGWRPLHDERRPQRIVKITSRSASGKAASIVAQGGEIPLDRPKARSFPKSSSTGPSALGSRFRARGLPLQRPARKPCLQFARYLQ